MLGHRLADRYPRTPEGWTVFARREAGPFTTRVEYRKPDGEAVVWESRFHRKHASTLSRAGAKRASRLWAPQLASWWIGVLFAIGSACFFVGPFPGFVNLVGSSADGVVFFVGSLFFTSAALLQLHGAKRSTADWWATLIQLVGTVYFNVDTFRAMQDSFDTTDVDRLVWRPEAFGSVCFLVSGLHRLPRGPRRGILRATRTLEWRIAIVNLAGCVLFVISTIGGYVLPSTGDALEPARSPTPAPRSAPSAS